MTTTPSPAPELEPTAVTPTEPLSEPAPGTGIPEQRTAADVPADAPAEPLPEERWHPRNRPPNAEVNNTHRIFNPTIGKFEDCECIDNPINPRKGAWGRSHLFGHKH